MSPVDWFLNGLAALRTRSWGSECPAGRPVPDEARCAALDCDSVRLTTLPVGSRGRVTCLENPRGSAAAKLAALGVLPGVEVAVTQRYPAFLLRLGYAEIALDSELAQLIRLRREPV